MSSSSKIQSVLLVKGMDVSRRTISRRLVDNFGLKAHKPAKKTRLTPAMKVKCLGFAKKHAKRGQFNSGNRCFFPTNLQYSSSLQRHRYVRRPTGKRFDERYTTQSTKHPPSIMIWGGMSVNGTAGLFFLPPGTTMNDQKFVDLLKDKLELHMAIYKCKIFMQDGAPCYHSKIVTQFLKSKKIQILDWPGNRADLNPIREFMDCSEGQSVWETTSQC